MPRATVQVTCPKKPAVFPGCREKPPDSQRPVLPRGSRSSWKLTILRLQMASKPGAPFLPSPPRQPARGLPQTPPLGLGPAHFRVTTRPSQIPAASCSSGSVREGWALRTPSCQEPTGLFLSSGTGVYKERHSPHTCPETRAGLHGRSATPVPTCFIPSSVEWRPWGARRKRMS